MELVYLVILVALVEYAIFIGLVGAGRGKYAVDAPAMTGNGEWERLLRVQQNTAEQLVLFIPGILGFALFVNPGWAAGLGCVFLVGRVVYFLGYRKAADKRTAGVLMSIPINLVLVLGALIGLLLYMF